MTWQVIASVQLWVGGREPKGHRQFNSGTIIHNFQEVNLFAQALPARAVKIKNVRHTRSPASR